MRRAHVVSAIAACLIAPLLVAAQQTEPAISIVLTDHHFRLTAPVEPGRLLWHVKNEGSEPHQALVIKLSEGIYRFTIE